MSGAAAGTRTTRRRGSLGCLGALVVVLMLLLTCVEVAIILRLDPIWFDRVAVWRPPPFEAEPLPIEDPAERAAVEAEIEGEIAGRQPPAGPGQVELLPHLAVSGHYDPVQGGQIKADWGAAVHLPPGAVAEATEISVTPVYTMPRQMAIDNAGAVVDLRIGDQPHYQFRKPVQLTLPYDSSSCDDPTMAVWDGYRWSRLPTSVNPDGTVTAELPHASIIGVIALAKILAAAGGGYFAATRAVSYSWLRPVIFASSLARAATYTGSETYEDSFFKIFYYTSGEHAVPADSAYPVSRQREGKPGVPNFVVDLAELFNEARYLYRKKGYNLKRHYVFVSKMKGAGNANLGGPIFISSTIVQKAVANGADPELEMRTTAAHELLHVAQADWFSITGAGRDRWWIEATGAYMGDKIWESDSSRPGLSKSSFIVRPIKRLLTIPMDKAPDPHYYAYSSFLRWLDEHYNGAGYKVYEKINSFGNANIRNIRSAVDGTCRPGLAAVFAEFAQDLYYEDLFSGTMLPTLHSGSARVQAETESNNPMAFGQTYKLVNLNMRRRDKLIWFHHEQTSLAELPHLSAWPFYFGVDRLEKKRGGKLVVKLSPHGTPAPGLWLYIGADHLGTTLPAPGSPSGLVFQDVATNMKPWVFDDFNSEGGLDRVTMIAINNSIGRTIPGFNLERWLLLRPEHVDFKRKTKREPRTWVITWDPNELQEEAAKVFKGYNVYRRLPGEEESAAVLVKQATMKQQVEDKVPDDREYVYTVTVLDTEGNESEHSLVEHDPFQGVWKGEIALKEGSLVRLCQPFIDALVGDEPDAEDLAFKKKLEVLAENLDAIAKLGIPVKLQIERYVGDRYFIRLTEVIWTKPDEPQAVEMKRQGDRALEMVEPPEEGPKAVLRITHKDRMREPRFEFPVKLGRADEEVEETWALRWDLKRKALLPDSEGEPQDR